MTAYDYPTYQEYCVARAAQGYQVIPETLWNALMESTLKQDEEYIMNFWQSKKSLHDVEKHKICARSHLMKRFEERFSLSDFDKLSI